MDKWEGRGRGWVKGVATLTPRAPLGPRAPFIVRAPSLVLMHHRTLTIRVHLKFKNFTLVIYDPQQWLKAYHNFDV